MRVLLSTIGSRAGSIAAAMRTDGARATAQRLLATEPHEPS